MSDWDFAPDIEDVERALQHLDCPYGMRWEVSDISARAGWHGNKVTIWAELVEDGLDEL